VRAPSAFILVAASGCGGAASLAVSNGGAVMASGHCTDATIVDRGSGMQVLAPGTAGCEAGTGYLVAERASGVVWQIGGSAWEGPVVANPVVVLIPDHTLGSGEAAKGLTTGGGGGGLTSGGDAKGLESGGGAKGPETANALVSGGDAGQVVELRKTVSRAHAAAGDSVTFTLVATNVGHVPLARLVIVDRLTHELKLTNTDAVTTPLKDGSTVLLWTFARPVAPGERVRVEFATVVP
jgi:uncharacterized repeat protein (TIGR01451 family)